MAGHRSATLQRKDSIADASNFTKRLLHRNYSRVIFSIFFEITFLTPQSLFLDIGLN